MAGPPYEKRCKFGNAASACPKRRDPHVRRVQVYDRHVHFSTGRWTMWSFESNFNVLLPGRNVSASESRALLGRRNYASGKQILPPGSKILPPGSNILPPGSNMLPPGSEFSPAGSNMFARGKQHFDLAA